MSVPRFKWKRYRVEVHPDSPVAQLAPAGVTPSTTPGMVTADVPLPDLSGCPRPGDKVDALLRLAAEVEHALLVQYLYAAYSLKDVPDSTLTPDQNKALTAWKTGDNRIDKIAKEEMGHLMTVQNLRLLLGLGPTFERQEFPILAHLFPFDFHLGPLTQTTLAEYVVAESPTNDSTHPKLCDIIAQANCQAGMPVNHVGVLYGLLGVVFAASPADVDQDAAGGDPWYVMVEDIAAAAYQQNPDPDAWHLGDGAFQAAQFPQAEASDLQVRLGNPQPPHAGIRLWQCANRADAKAALRDIGLQGEGAAQAPGEKSHFDRFYDIYTGTNDVLPFPADGDWVPTAAVPMNPTTEAGGTGPNAITAPKARDYAELADLRYALALGILGHYLVTPPAWRKNIKIGGWAIDEMLNLKSLSTVLVKLPRSASGTTGGVAALPFGLPDVLIPPTIEAESQALLVTRFQQVIAKETAIAGTYSDDDIKRARDDHAQKLAKLEQHPTTTPGGTQVMLTFDDVKKILEDAVNGDDIGEHGNFWRTTLDKFKTLVLFQGTPREMKVLVVGDGPGSNLIKALRGQPPFDGTYAPQMPEGYPPVPADKIDQIEQWINAGCP